MTNPFYTKRRTLPAAAALMTAALFISCAENSTPTTVQDLGFGGQTGLASLDSDVFTRPNGHRLAGAVGNGQ